jgi:hypothetical protein
LKSREDFADLIRLAEVGHGVSDGIVVFEAEQWRQLFLIKFFHSDVDVMREHEVEEDLLLAVKAGADRDS